ncbi:hypothetical protein NC661_09610 [Aquibacillus koreensis]|uniref:Peptidyl-prolyl cis-trans isomerase n=1 Tax=Aquibacillus koreensis TaxID=279446 RepID=A0A9X4AJR9_9BACI|nr:hypothetical protein [Aquibacillus koreensis]MCT2538100.1 hypothetical protein [Aquibacillus koreensis]MDC3420623.1 hypothetical protein [Aquibacillus koreensis]
MIIQLKGKVAYPLTIDPTVWIFDDRKIPFEEAFLSTTKKEETEVDELKKAADRFQREVYRQSVKPPVNKSISRIDKETLLKSTYVIPFEDFLNTAEIAADAKNARLETNEGDVTITIDQLQNSLLLFAKDGKPLKETGPVHLYFRDGTNFDSPIKGFNKIIIE